MYLIREVMNCKPGKVRPMVEKFLAMSKLSEKMGMSKMRIMTDFMAEQYWTVVAEFEVKDLGEFEQMMKAPPAGADEAMKQMGEIMKDYHDLVARGRREVWKLEG